MWLQYIFILVDQTALLSCNSKCPSRSNFTVMLTEFFLYIPLVSKFNPARQPNTTQHVNTSSLFKIMHTLCNSTQIATEVAGMFCGQLLKYHPCIPYFFIIQNKHKKKTYTVLKHGQQHTQSLLPNLSSLFTTAYYTMQYKKKNFMFYVLD